MADAFRRVFSSRHPVFRWILAFSLIYGTCAVGFALPRLGGRMRLRSPLAQRSSRSGTPVGYRAHHESPVNVSLKARNHLYRIAQEAVQNALKHSRARAIDIELRARDDMLRLEIRDDGRGLAADAATRGGLGMRTMRFRASAIGGRLQIGGRSGGGNSVVCEVPQFQRTPNGERAARAANS